MNVEKIGLTNSVSIKQTAFKGGDVTKSQEKEHSDNNGAKFFAVAAGIAAVAIAGIIIKKKIDAKHLVQEGEKVANAVVNEKRLANMSLQDATKLDSALTINDLEKNERRIKSATSPKAHSAKQKALIKMFKEAAKAELKARNASLEINDLYNQFEPHGA